MKPEGTTPAPERRFKVLPPMVITHCLKQQECHKVNEFEPKLAAFTAKFRFSLPSHAGLFFTEVKNVLRLTSKISAARNLGQETG
jgi:hypothetical protein